MGNEGARGVDLPASPSSPDRTVRTASHAGRQSRAFLRRRVFGLRPAQSSCDARSAARRASINQFEVPARPPKAGRGRCSGGFACQRDPPWRSASSWARSWRLRGRCDALLARFPRRLIASRPLHRMQDGDLPADQMGTQPPAPRARTRCNCKLTGNWLRLAESG